MRATAILASQISGMANGHSRSGVPGGSSLCRRRRFARFAFARACARRAGPNPPASRSAAPVPRSCSARMARASAVHLRRRRRGTVRARGMLSPAGPSLEPLESGHRRNKSKLLGTVLGGMNVPPTGRRCCRGDSPSALGGEILGSCLSAPPPGRPDVHEPSCRPAGMASQGLRPRCVAPSTVAC